MATPTEQLQQLYVAYFSRPADVDGLNYWLNALANGGTIAQVSAAFAVQPEYTSVYGGKQPSEVIDTVYMNLFGRHAEQGGLDYWGGILQANPSLISQIVTAIVAGAKNPDGTPNADGIAYNDKVAAAGLFTDELKTVGNEAERIAYAKGTADVLAVAKNFIASVHDDATLATATTNLHTTAQQLVTVTTPVTNFTLTTGIDAGANFVGGAGNDVFTAADSAASAKTFTSLDSLDGGAGNDTLNIIQTSAVVVDTSISVKNIETANVTSAASVNLNTSNWTGLTTLNVTSAATAEEQVRAATTTAVTVANSTDFRTDVTGGGGVLTITNGANKVAVGNNGTISGSNVSGNADGVAATSTDANAWTTVNVTGGTTVDVTDNSGTSGAVGSTLTTATVSGNTGAVTLTGKGLTNVNLSSSASAVSIANTTAGHTLNLGINAVTGGVAVTDAAATTVNLKVTGASATTASNINLTTNVATKLAVNTAAALTLTTTALQAADKLATVTVAGAGSFTADLSGISSLTSVNAAASTGANTVTIDDTLTTYTGGSGVDVVTVTGVATTAISGGAGSADVINLAGTGGTILTAATGAKFTNFEVLSTTGGQGTFDVSLLSGITALTEGALVAAVTYNNVAAGTGLTITDNAGFGTTYNLANALGSNDSLNLSMSSAGAINGNTVTANGIETINVTVSDSDTTYHKDTLALSDNALTTLKISGTAGLALTAADTTITSVDASGIKITNTGLAAAGDGFSWTSGAVTGNLVVKGSTSGYDSIDVHLAATAGKTVTITEYAGTNTVVGSATLVNNITGGTGADTITGGSAADTIVGGGGADVIWAKGGADLVTVSGTTATVKQALNDSGVNTATNTQTAELTQTLDVIKGLVAGDKIDFTGMGAGGATIVTGDLGLTNATNLQGTAGKVVFAAGTYDATAGTFTYNASGVDTAMTVDQAGHGGAGAGFETIILVGYHVGATTTAAAGVITLG